MPPQETQDSWGAIFSDILDAITEWLYTGYPEGTPDRHYKVAMRGITVAVVTLAFVFGAFNALPTWLTGPVDDEGDGGYYYEEEDDSFGDMPAFELEPYEEPYDWELPDLTQ